MYHRLLYISVCVILFAIVFVLFTSNDICPWVSPILRQMFPVEPKPIDWPCSWNRVEVTWLCSYPNSRAPFERKREKKKVYSLCIIYNWTSRTKGIVWPVRSLTSHDGRLHEPSRCMPLYWKKRNSRSIAQCPFQSNKREKKLYCYSLSELTHMKSTCGVYIL